jgi:hypothetical protein
MRAYNMGIIIYFWRRRKAAKGGKKNAGWNTVKTVHAIASILLFISMCSEFEFEFNLHSIEQQELFLVPHERVAPSTSHLRQTVNAANKHSEVCKCDHPAKDLDLPQRD